MVPRRMMLHFSPCDEDLGRRAVGPCAASWLPVVLLHVDGEVVLCFVPSTTDGTNESEQLSACEVTRLTVSITRCNAEEARVAAVDSTSIHEPSLRSRARLR